MTASPTPLSAAERIVAAVAALPGSPADPDSCAIAYVHDIEDCPVLSARHYMLHRRSERWRDPVERAVASRTADLVAQLNATRRELADARADACVQAKAARTLRLQLDAAHRTLAESRREVDHTHNVVAELWAKLDAAHAELKEVGRG